MRLALVTQKGDSWIVNLEERESEFEIKKVSWRRPHYLSHGTAAIWREDLPGSLATGGIISKSSLLAAIIRYENNIL